MLIDYPQTVYFMMGNVLWLTEVRSRGERTAFKHSEKILMDEGNLRRKKYKISNKICLTEKKQRTLSMRR